MVVTANTNTNSKAIVWTGYVLTGLAVLFLLFDSVIKIVQAAPAVESNVQLGYPAEYVLVFGVIELICIAAYIFPRTAVLGAILLTGCFGGATATHVRAGSPAFSVIFPIIIGLMVWGGLYLRDARLRAIVPFRK